MELIVPRPTEYKRIVFKSKSEAIVARSLDLEGFIWEYEPKELRLDDGWVPDFWVVFQGKDTTQPPSICSMFIEYKPSQPSYTYLVELNIRFRRLHEKRGLGIGWLMCGNPFDAQQKRSWRGYDMNDEGLWINREVDLANMCFRKWDEAKQYRFDLNHHA